MKRKLLLCAAILFLLLAVIIALYPIISTAYNEHHQSLIHTQYLQQIVAVDTGTLEQARNDAQTYNASIIPGAQADNVFSNEALATAAETYEKQLNLANNGIMGYVRIPKIDVKLPIYHGTASGTLDRGIGHLLGTSLPIGGSATHSVLTAHSGMASQRLFSDLPQLEVGDVFYLDVLDTVLAYQVDQINTVLPYDTSLLGIEAEKDLCTLVTCTPFGINTHRLLVRGSRIPYEEAEIISNEHDAAAHTANTSSTWTKEYMKGLILGLGIVLLLLLILLIIWICRRLRHGKK